MSKPEPYQILGHTGVTKNGCTESPESMKADCETSGIYLDLGYVPFGGLPDLPLARAFLSPIFPASRCKVRRTFRCAKRRELAVAKRYPPLPTACSRNSLARASGTSMTRFAF